MPRLKAQNLAISTLAEELPFNASSCVVADASVLPDVPFRAVIGSGDNFEIVEVTAKDGNTLTLLRGLEGTTAQTWAAGTRFVNRLTAGYWDEVCRLIQLTSAEPITISNDTITIIQSFHIVDTEGQASSDDLATIQGGEEGDLLFLRCASSSRTVVIKHGIGNIRIPGGQDFALDSTDKAVLLLYDGTNWLLVGAAGSASFDALTDTPASKAGSAGLYVRVDPTASTLIYDGAADMETVSRTIYVDADNGDDTTGDGSSAKPFRTYSKALSTVRNVIADGVTITIVLKAATNLYTPVSTGRLCIGSGRVVIQGELVQLLSDTCTGGTATTIVKENAGWEADAYKGKLVKFVKDGTTYWRLIETNTSDTLTVIGRLEVTPASGDTFEIYDWGTFISNTSWLFTQGNFTVQDIACTSVSGLSFFRLRETSKVTFVRCFVKAAGSGVQAILIEGNGQSITLETCLLDGNGYTYRGIASINAVGLQLCIYRSWIRNWSDIGAWLGGSGGYIQIREGTIVSGGSRAIWFARKALGTLWSPVTNGARDKIRIENATQYGLYLGTGSGCMYTSTDFVDYVNNATNIGADSTSWYLSTE